MIAKIYCDGASRGNPGDAGIGCVLEINDKKVEISEYIGITTNNVAEYRALIRGLEKALELGADEIKIYSDSELIVRQLEGIYKVKNPNLIPLYERVLRLLENFNSYSIHHISREENQSADKLAKKASWKTKK